MDPCSGGPCLRPFQRESQILEALMQRQTHMGVSFCEDFSLTRVFLNGVTSCPVSRCPEGSLGPMELRSQVSRHRHPEAWACRRRLFGAICRTWGVFKRWDRRVQTCSNIGPAAAYNKVTQAPSHTSAHTCASKGLPSKSPLVRVKG